MDGLKMEKMCFMSTDDQLYELQKVCNRHIDPLAKWVLYAVSRYIYTDRATRNFIERFNNINPDRFEGIVSECLNGDKSDDAILKKFKEIM